IGSTLVAVLQDFVGFADFLELVLTGGITRILVRMPFHRELAESRLQAGFIDTAFDFQRLVIAGLRHCRSGTCGVTCESRTLSLAQEKPPPQTGGGIRRNALR